MPPSPPRLLSDSPDLPVLAGAFGTMAFGFGINAIVNLLSEITLFGLQDLASIASPFLIDALMVAFGAKLIGATVAIYANTIFGTVGITAYGLFVYIRHAPLLLAYNLYNHGFSLASESHGFRQIADGSKGSKKALGCILIAGGCVAGLDGLVCKTYVGGGEWNHWDYDSAMVVLGLVQLGIADKRRI